MDERVQSFHSWLAVNAPHISSLTVNWDTDPEPSVEELIKTCISTCCNAAPLQDLVIASTVEYVDFPTLIWLLPASPTLRFLHLDFHLYNDFLSVDVPLQQFTALSCLSLRNFYGLNFAPGCWLPNSLTHVKIEDLQHGFPTQASWRTRQPH